MNRPRLYSCLLWLLPLFALRAIIPAGFMLSPSAAGELRLVLCTSVAGTPAPAGAGAAIQFAHGGHDAHAHPAQAENASATQPDHSSHKPLERSVCPYGIAGTAQAPGVPHLTADTPPASTSFVDFFTDPSLISVPVLIDRIRGPPLA